MGLVGFARGGPQHDGVEERADVGARDAARGAGPRMRGAGFCGCGVRSSLQLRLLGLAWRSSYSAAISEKLGARRSFVFPEAGSPPIVASASAVRAALRACASVSGGVRPIV